MADATVISVDAPPILPTDFDTGLSVPPLDTAFFSQQLNDSDGAIGEDQNIDDDLDFDLSFDDLYIPSAEELDDLLNPTQFPEFYCQPGYGASFPQFAPNLDHQDGFSGDRSFSGSEVLKSLSSGLEAHQISGCVNATSQESNGSSRATFDNCCSDVKVMNCASPESQGSGNCGSNVSENSNNCATKSVSSSPNLISSSIRVGVVDQKIELEEPIKVKVNSSLLKRKKNCDDLPVSAVESRRTNKSRKSNCNSENNDSNSNGGVSEEDEKRKVRLIRNRESAQLSRQRRKHYVEELEEKVRMMQSTIQDLNGKVSYFMAENATLRQHMGGGGAVPHPPVGPPPPGMYPHPAMVYPWMPYAPPYMMKPGSQVPLVAIPKLKQQQTTQAPKVNKKVESRKNEGPKTKKVAGISFLGLLFFVLLFGGLAPMINMRYGGVRETLTGGESYVGGGFYEKHHGRVLTVNGSEPGEKYGEGRCFSKSSLHCGGKPDVEESTRLKNASEPLVASLYVPRNDKLVKIDGNLIIHSVLASEKAMNGGGETGLAIPGDLSRALPVPGVQRDGARHPHLRALGSSSAQKDGRLQQWFREGLAGPMLTSGMCTEVFQFEVSPASASGAIFPATTIARNITEEQIKNSTHLSKDRNRRILRGLPIPLPESTKNISKHHTRRNSQKENLKGNNSASPMVVSVLVDPREAGDADVDGVMGAKSLPRIFVVVLIDSVKYVTYSCMLPFKGSALPLVTT